MWDKAAFFKYLPLYVYLQLVYFKLNNRYILANNFILNLDVLQDVQTHLSEKVYIQ